MEDVMDCCYLEEGDDLWRMEDELSRAVVVTITGARPSVDLAAAAAALHAEFNIGPDDMSIRDFHSEDFLVLCRRQSTRDRMTRQGGMTSPAHGFSLSLRLWLRQAQATGISLPFLVPLALVGVPAHAWTRRTADCILWGSGLVGGVTESTATRRDMSCFKVWVRTGRPGCIPERKQIYIEEPRRCRRGAWTRAVRTTSLWYNIRI